LLDGRVKPGHDGDGKDWHVTQAIKTHLEDGILTVTIDRPKANAIDAVTSKEMSDVFIRFRDDPAQRVAILTGAGERFFSAGWDLKAAAEGESPEADYGTGGFGGFTELWDLKKPVICAMNGFAIGGGFELAMAADIIVAADHAEAWLPEIRLGILPDAGGVLRLPRRVTHAVAMEWMMTGRRVSAQEGWQRGLYNHVVPAHQVLPKAQEIAREILQAAPLSLMALKEIVVGSEELSLEQATQKMRSGAFKTYHQALRSEDAKEGPRAFAEKRAPKWKGK
jgi:crotonobetainyl-CoA hydratase